MMPLLGSAQQGAPGDENEELKRQIERLKLEKEKAELEKQRAEFERDRVKAEREALRESLPKSEAKALEGKITLDDKVFLEGQVLAYASVSRIAEKISQEVGAEAKTLIIYHEGEFASLATYHSVGAQIEALQKEYERLLGPEVEALPAAALAPEVAAALLKSVIDVVALFRTEVDIKTAAFTIDEIAVAAELGHRLAGSARVIHPSIYLPEELLVKPENSSELVTRLKGLYAQRARAAGIIADYESKPPADQASDPHRKNIPLLKALNEQANKLTVYLTTPDEKSRVAPLMQLLKAESLKKKVAEVNNAILYLKVQAAGGSNKTTRNLFTGSKLFHNGGAIVAYSLLDNEGVMKVSGVLYCGSEYTKWEKGKSVKFICSDDLLGGEVGTASNPGAGKP